MFPTETFGRMSCSSWKSWCPSNAAWTFSSQRDNEVRVLSQLFSWRRVAAVTRRCLNSLFFRVCWPFSRKKKERGGNRSGPSFPFGLNGRGSRIQILVFLLVFSKHQALEKPDVTCNKGDRFPPTVFDNRLNGAVDLYERVLDVMVRFGYFQSWGSDWTAIFPWRYVTHLLQVCHI